MKNITLLTLALLLFFSISALAQMRVNPSADGEIYIIFSTITKDRDGVITPAVVQIVGDGSSLIIVAVPSDATVDLAMRVVRGDPLGTSYNDDAISGGIQPALTVFTEMGEVLTLVIGGSLGRDYGTVTLGVGFKRGSYYGTIAGGEDEEILLLEEVRRQVQNR